MQSINYHRGTFIGWYFQMLSGSPKKVEDSIRPETGELRFIRAARIEDGDDLREEIHGIRQDSD